jgi:hypothetical protein
MSLPELHTNSSRQEMRKALIRLRMEMHRQEIRHEVRATAATLAACARHEAKPAGRFRHQARATVGRGRIVTLLGFLTGKGARWWRTGRLTRPDSLGTSARAADQTDPAKLRQALTHLLAAFLQYRRDEPL